MGVGAIAWHVLVTCSAAKELENGSLPRDFSLKLESDARRTPAPAVVTQIGRQMASGRTQVAVACIGSDQELEAAGRIQVGCFVPMYIWSPRPALRPPHPHPGSLSQGSTRFESALQLHTLGCGLWSGPRVEKRRA